DGLMDAFRVRIETHELCYARQFALLVRLQIFVSHQEEVWLSLARRQPAVDVVGPGTDAAPEFAVHPAGNEFFHGATFGDRTQLHLPVIVGNSDIARVTHNVDDAPVAGVEALVALEHARTREAAQNPVGGLV